MIPQISIQPATETRAPWDELDMPAADGSRTAKYVLAALALAAVLIVAAATSGGFDRAWNAVLAGWDGKPAVSAKARQAKAIAKLITETHVDEITPEAEGADAVARNALLPVSTLPVEAARPFYLPALSVAQETNAERCLTQAIYYEAATESDAGKAAVAQVIINRMRHPAYPNTICGVVYQGSSRPGCQFSFACDGSMRRAPMPALWRRAGEIARAALAGHVETSVGMATHYHADYVLPRWAPKLTKIEQIGAHIFYRWPGSWGKPRAFTDGYAGAEWIPAFSSLYQGGKPVDGLIADMATAEAIAPVRDPTDYRADNDVGGRVDVTKGWTPTIPDPTQTKSRFDALTSQQAAASAATDPASAK